MMIGIVSDTHGLLRQEMIAALDGCNEIIHAGDLGTLEVYERLAQIAPTVAIRGNVDRGSWAKRFPETLRISVGGVNTHVLHDLHGMTFDPAVEKVDLVISGHSHQPALQEKTGVIYLNPGSAGPRRFSLPITLARMTIGLEDFRVELLDVLGGTVLQTLTASRHRVSA